MLQIIPVIDIRDGKVVHARGGDRQNYPPLQSVLTQSVEVEQVMADLLAWFPFPCIYIADLDAIETGNLQPSRYQQLSRQFSGVEIWLDAGFKAGDQLQRLAEMNNLRLVVGSETLEEPALLTDRQWAGRLILSLDKRQGRFLGLKALLSQPELWTDKVIMMSLDYVGTGQGPDLDWLEQLMAERGDIDWFVAGGVKDQRDLEEIEQKGGKGVLIASALHTGQLNRQTVDGLMRK